jgi:phospholipid/cholesterol/gamma-HCH transport system substrate-binding protein
MSGNVKVGIAFFLGLALLLIFTVAITDIPFFKEGYTINAYFESTGGLAKDSNIFFRGVRVGKVKDVDFDTEEQKVKVVCYIFNTDVKIPRNSRFVIETATLLGGMHLAIDLHMKPVHDYIRDGSRVNGAETKPFSQLIDKFSEVTEGLNNVLKDNRTNVKKAFASIENASNRLNKTDNTIGAMLSERELYDDLLVASGKIRDVAENFDNGTFSKFMTDPTVYENLESITGDMHDILTQMQSKDNNLGRKLFDDTIVRSLESASTKFESMVKSVENGEGIFGKALSKDSEKLYFKLESMLTNLDDFTAALNNKRNSFSRFLYDSGGLFENIESFSGSLKSIGEKLDGRDPDGKKKEKPGTIAKLLDDENVMYDKISGALDNLNEAFGPIAALRTHMGVSYRYYDKQYLQTTSLYLKLVPRKERYFLVGGSLAYPSEDGPIAADYDDIGEGKQYIFFDILLAQIFRFNDRDKDEWNDITITLRGGLIEGKVGGGVDFDFLKNFRLSVEARDTHRSRDFNENVDFYMGRAYASMKFLDYFRLYAGVDNIADHGALMFGIAAEWEDEDIRSFVGLASAAQ